VDEYLLLITSVVLRVSSNNNRFTELGYTWKKQLIRLSQLRAKIFARNMVRVKRKIILTLALIFYIK